MNVSLTPELEKFVEGKVESGLYNNASEVVREGLRLLKEHDEIRVKWRDQIERGQFSYMCDPSLRAPLSADVESYAQHRPARIDEHGRLPERRAELVVAGGRFVRRAVQRVQHVGNQLDPAESAGANRPRDPQIQDGLRLEASRASRLQEDALAALVQRDLRRRRPRLAAEVLNIRAQHHAGVR